MPASARSTLQGAVVLHDGLRASVRVHRAVADCQQIAADAIEQHDAGIAQVLIVFLVEFAGAIDEHQRRARLQAPCCLIAFAVARCLRIQPSRQCTRALIDRAGALCPFFFIKRERCEQPVDGPGQLGGQSLRADDRLPHGIARDAAFDAAARRALGATEGDGKPGADLERDDCWKQHVRHAELVHVGDERPRPEYFCDARKKGDQQTSTDRSNPGLAIFIYRLRAFAEFGHDRR
jgi:hypothetical protein